MDGDDSSIFQNRELLDLTSAKCDICISIVIVNGVVWQEITSCALIPTGLKTHSVQCLSVIQVQSGVSFVLFYGQ